MDHTTQQIYVSTTGKRFEEIAGNGSTAIAATMVLDALSRSTNNTWQIDNHALQIWIEFENAGQ